ncbi:MAG: glycosyltransferase family 2 protein [Eggerthellaceae bacterium]
MSPSKLSIIIPIYNAEDYLKQCLDSVVGQGFDEDLQVICVNDGSSDQSASILEDYRKRYSCITVITQENAGVSAARNNGLRHVTGDYLMFIDSDDWLKHESLSVILSYISQDKPDCILFGIEQIDGNSSGDIGELPAASVWGTSHEMLVRMMDIYSPYGGYVHGKVVRSNLVINNGCLLEKFDPSKSMMEDEWFWIHVAKRCNRILFLNKVLYCYRFNDSGLSRLHTPERNIEEVKMKVLSYEFMKENCPQAAQCAKARVTLAVGGFVRRYYVLGDKKALADLRPYWKQFPGRSLMNNSEVPLALKIGALCCDVLMGAHIPVALIKPFKKLAAKGMQ